MDSALLEGGDFAQPMQCYVMQSKATMRVYQVCLGLTRIDQCNDFGGSRNQTGTARLAPATCPPPFRLFALDSESPVHEARDRDAAAAAAGTSSSLGRMSGCGPPGVIFCRGHRCISLEIRIGKAFVSTSTPLKASSSAAAGRLTKGLICVWLLV